MHFMPVKVVYTFCAAAALLARSDVQNTKYTFLAEALLQALPMFSNVLPAFN